MALSRAAQLLSIRGQQISAAFRGVSAAALGARRHASSGAGTADQAPVTKATAALVFERLPIVCPPPEAWEVEYRTWQAEWNAPYYKTLPGNLIDEKTTEDADGATGAASWVPAPTVTAADEAGDRRSLDRRLSESLYLVVRAKGGKGGAWQLPEAEVAPGETLREAAARVLVEALGDADTLQPYFVGNAPAAHVRAADDPASGTFLMRAQLIRGTPELLPGAPYSDAAWAAKDELPELLGEESPLARTLALAL